MAVRIYLEIGHEASTRNKKTTKGFTHDWEVFVRGCDGADIQYYVEEVVFYLHQTFQNPTRVIKTPPYSVKESGYAGFNLDIDIYLKNNGEPKKISFSYDLHLQAEGAPPIYKSQTEKYVFNNVTEEFRHKLLKGGGVDGSSSSSQDVNHSRSFSDDKNQMTSKPKLSGSEFAKKPKIKPVMECSRGFQEVFGFPIFTSKATQETKQPKHEIRAPDKPRPKHSPSKERDKEKSKEKTDPEKKSKEEKKHKDRTKDRERSKHKAAKKEKSPRPKSPSPTPKRSPPRSSSPTSVKHKEPKPPEEKKEKRDKTEERKSKKEKRNKEHKQIKHGGDAQKTEEHKSRERKEPSKPKETVTPPPVPKVEKKEKVKEKVKEEKSAEKVHSEKYKHKKKDKEKREKKEEKLSQAEKKPEKPPEPKPNLFKPEPPPAKKERNALFSTPALDDESSNSSLASVSSSDRAVPEKKTLEVEKVKEKVKKDKGYKEDAVKCKQKSIAIEANEPVGKPKKEPNVNNNSDGEHEVPMKTYIVGDQEVEQEYFEVLRDLQHKIMDLKDNSDLQKVVQLIAETGRYEVSAHTFDFDLCLLERSTVQQLQDFFTS